MNDRQARPGEPKAILMAHGSGGQLSHELTERLFVPYFHNPTLAELGDSAVIDMSGLRFQVPGSRSGELETWNLQPQAARLAFTTDSYVISPLFFPGGDIGRLAVCGTVNDLAVAGAQPYYLSAGFILEEGLPLATLERVVASMAEVARAAGVQIVTGDTKVVDHGAADGLFVNTAGLGIIPPGIHLSPAELRPGDAVLVSGTLGDHGMAVMMQREGLQFTSPLVSDCAPLNGLIDGLMAACPGAVRCLRDPTRGGLVATLNEWAQRSGMGLLVQETSIPLREEVRGACEVLGLDPLYVANEGKAVIGVAPDAARAALDALHQHPLGRQAAVIGRVTSEHRGRVVLETPLGAHRVLDMLVGEQLPRIC